LFTGEEGCFASPCDGGYIMKKKKWKYEFHVRGVKYHVGGKLFPLASRKDGRLFLEPITEEYDNGEFWRLVDEICVKLDGFESGFCYKNSEYVYELGVAMGLDVEYYVGWLFMAPHTLPVHHAWVVVDGKHLIDVSVNVKVQNYILENVDLSVVDWRSRIAEGIANIEKERLPVKDWCVSGLVRLPMIYVGSPDKSDSARKRFRDLMRDYPNHPTYIQQGRNKLDKSDLQKEVDRFK
jgi:hypothetical protein